MSAPVREGDLLDGKYRVERVLGEGGMGVVVAATHVQLGERVALKFLLTAHARDAEVVKRFEREARTAARIRSEHVTRILDVGRLPTGAPYMVMEYLEGMDLRQVLDTRGPLPMTDAVDHAAQGCVALAEAHRVGVVHRDMKPANLFLTRRSDGSPCIKLLDFGISKLQTPEVSKLTRGALGTPEYMSPEQLRDASSVDARSDVWGMGMVLFELLTKRRPFDTGSGLGPLIMAILQQAPMPLSAARGDAPAALEAVVLRCLEKDPAARYRDMGELASALLPFASKRGRAAVETAIAVAGQLPASQAPRIAGGTWRTDDGSWSGPPPSGGSAQGPAVVMETLVPATVVDRAMNATTPMGVHGVRGHGSAPLSGPIGVTHVDTPAPASAPRTLTAASATLVGSSSSSPFAWVGAVVAIAALGAGGLWLAMRGSAGAAAEPPPELSVSRVAAPMPPVVAPPETAPTASAAASAADVATPTPPSAAPRPTPGGPARTAARAAAPPPPSPPPAPAATGGPNFGGRL